MVTAAATRQGRSARRMGERVAPLAAVFGAAILAFLFFELDRMRNGLATNRELARTKFAVSAG